MILCQILVNPQQNVIHNYAVFYKQGCSKTKAKIDIMVKVGQGGVAGHLRPNIWHIWRDTVCLESVRFIITVSGVVHIVSKHILNVHFILSNTVPMNRMS